MLEENEEQREEVWEEEGRERRRVRSREKRRHSGRGRSVRMDNLMLFPLLKLTSKDLNKKKNNQKNSNCHKTKKQVKFLPFLMLLLSPKNLL